MANKDSKTEWGTRLEWASKNRFEIKEFWGDHHYDQALAELSAMQVLHAVHYHCFSPLVREVEAKA